LGNQFPIVNFQAVLILKISSPDLQLLMEWKARRGREERVATICRHRDLHCGFGDGKACTHWSNFFDFPYFMKMSS
jgi:hypothetical protein